MAHHIKARLLLYRNQHRVNGLIDEEEEWLLAAVDKTEADIRFRHLNPLDAPPLDLPGPPSTADAHSRRGHQEDSDEDDEDDGLEKSSVNDQPALNLLLPATPTFLPQSNLSLQYLYPVAIRKLAKQSHQKLEEEEEEKEKEKKKQGYHSSHSTLSSHLKSYGR